MFQFHFGSIGRDQKQMKHKAIFKFQFHFGSIGSCNVINQWKFLIVSIPLWFDWKDAIWASEIVPAIVSIPLWFDWKIQPGLSTKTNITFQFHFGSIGSFTHFRPKLLFFFVSIPLWFDWKNRDVEAVKTYMPLFQFHFGSIGSKPTLRHQMICFLFQFHFGSIGSYWPNDWIRNRQVSIPLWFDWKFCRNRSKYRFGVSIPLWFDWKIGLTCLFYSDKAVSIPLWFDWKVK